MYRLDTHQSRTDLYDINKGAAQVIDLSPLRNNLAREEAQRERERLLKQKEQQGRQDDIESQLAKNHGISYMAHDQPLIAEQTQAVRDYTLKNIDKLRNGDINAKLGFDQALGQLNNTYAMSHDKRTKWEQANQLIAANPDKYRPDSVEKQMEYAGSKNTGDFSYDPANYLKENFDTQKYIKDVVRPIAEDIASKGAYDYVNPQTGEKTTYTKDNLTPAESEKLFHDTVLKNPKAYEQASYDISQDPEAQKKYGHDINSYLKDKFFDQFVIKRDKTSINQPSSSDQRLNEDKEIHTEISKNEDGSTRITPRTKSGKQLSITKGGVTYTLSDINTDESAQPNKTTATGTRTLNKQELEQNKQTIAANKIKETNIEQAQNLFNKNLLTPEEFDLAKAKNIPTPLPYKNDEIEATFGYDKIHDILEHNQPKEGEKKLNMFNLLKGEKPKGYTINDKRGGTTEKTITRTGIDKKTGKKVIQYSDGSIEYK